MRRTKTEPLKEVLKAYIEAMKMQSKLQETSIVNSWEKVVGSVFSKMTEQIFIRNKKLFVKINSSIARNELMLGKHLLIKNLNKVTGSDTITDIVFL